MQQLNRKGDVFVLGPDGTVCKMITKFSDIFADIDIRLPPLWEEEWNRKLWEDRLRHKRQSSEAKKRLIRQRQKLAAVVGIVLAALILM